MTNPCATTFAAVLEQLAIGLLRGLVSFSAADTGYLILPREGGLQIVAAAGQNQAKDFHPQPLSAFPELPTAAIESCWQHQHPLDGQTEAWPEGNAFKPARWACIPLIMNGAPLGTWYLSGNAEAKLDPLELIIYLDAAANQVASCGDLPAIKADRDRLAELVEERSAMLAEAEKELARRERLATLGQLIATVSHELRNPLGTVRGSVFLIANKLLGKDLGVERALDRAERNIVRCDRIIEDLLAYTRSHDLELEHVRIDRWLDNTLEEYSFPHDVTVKVALRSSLIMKVEPERLRRCLINLINNACDAMKAGTAEEEDGTKRLTVMTKANDKKQRLEIIIVDSGPGIPEEELSKILEPLYSTKSFGVGLGLPTVVQIMEQHKGGLEIKSIVGQGTAMTLWIPFNEHSKREDGSPVPEPAGDSQEEPG